MKTSYGIIEKDLNLKGWRFKKNLPVKIWDTGSVTSIQPLFLNNILYESLWYLLPDYLVNHIMKVDPRLCENLNNQIPALFS